MAGKSNLWSNQLPKCLAIHIFIHKNLNQSKLTPPFFFLLPGTLRMFQTHACQGDELKLKCPKNSAISIYSAHFGGLRTAQEPARLCPHLSLEQFESSNEIRLHDRSTDRSGEIRLNTTARCSSVQAFRIVDSKCRDNQTCVLPATIGEFLTQPNLTLITEQEARRLRQSTEVMIELCSSDVVYAEAMWKCKPSKLFYKPNSFIFDFSWCLTN